MREWAHYLQEVITPSQSANHLRGMEEKLRTSEEHERRESITERDVPTDVYTIPRRYLLELKADGTPGAPNVVQGWRPKPGIAYESSLVQQ